ncbi:TniQ family protein [Nitratireductor rhodophyticola]|uniref:TniQ family protein n=1 Tax=Nitratireductor rhodophyticola TaxID=2854036 RepID=UPI002AC8FAFA|nr:TniQ family protein [Nitratireductor rhodophyticola]WPZ14559.1 TniQ family protein [Nitratireductor rhodophyticola]WPZ15032.1 TniQ family protein [Nitratireductor rhodophyticola]
MNPVLGLSCDLAERETPTSLASRLAIRNNSGGAIGFCLDMGLKWNALIRGEASEIARLAELSGAHASTLQRFACRVVTGGRVRIGRETLVRGSIIRTCPRACPYCLRGSIAENGFSGAFCRADWQLVSNRTCELHHTPLLSLPSEQHANGNYDFAEVVRKHWLQITNISNTATDRAPSDLEHYLRKRLSGKRGETLIDRLSLQVVCKASETLGARVEFGPDIRFSDLSESQLHVAGGTGFKVLQGSADRVRGVLLDLKAEFAGRFAYYNRDLGIFYVWLNSHARSSRGAKALADLVREHIVENYPLEPGVKILGRRIDNPRCFSLTRSRRSLGVRREKFARLIASTTATSDDEADQPANLTLQQMEALQEKTNDMMTIVEASCTLACRYEQVVRFIRAGLLVQRKDRTAVPYLSRIEVEALIAPVRNLKTARPGPKLSPLASVYKATRASVHEIFHCFLEGRLTSARRDPTKTGIEALLLEPEEVMRCLATPSAGDPPMAHVAQQLRLDTRTIRYLEKRGELRIYTARHPYMRGRRSFVGAVELQRFQKEFITVGELSAILGIPSGPLAVKLDAKGLRPRKVPKRVRRIYRRADIEQAFNLDLQRTSRTNLE